MDDRRYRRNLDGERRPSAVCSSGCRTAASWPCTGSASSRSRERATVSGTQRSTGPWSSRTNPAKMGPPICAARFECVEGSAAAAIPARSASTTLSPANAGWSAGAVGPPARGAFHDARGRAAHACSLRAGNRPAPLVAPSSSWPPARPPGRPPVPADVHVPSRRPAHVPHRPHPGPALPAEPRTPPPGLASPPAPQGSAPPHWRRPPGLPGQHRITTDTTYT